MSCQLHFIKYACSSVMPTAFTFITIQFVYEGEVNIKHLTVIRVRTFYYQYRL